MSTEKQYPKPYQDRVIVTRKKAETKTAGGIIIPETVLEENISQGTVVAIGPDVGKNKLVGQFPVAGDFVEFGEYAGKEITYNDEKYLVMRESDIMCKL